MVGKCRNFINFVRSDRPLDFVGRPDMFNVNC